LPTASSFKRSQRLLWTISGRPWSGRSRWAWFRPTPAWELGLELWWASSLRPRSANRSTTPTAVTAKQHREASPKRLQRGADHQPVSVKEVALGLPPPAWRQIGWRPGCRQMLRSRFAVERERPTHRDYMRTNGQKMKHSRQSAGCPPCRRRSH
jgi:hypothetical protein